MGTKRYRSKAALAALLVLACVGLPTAFEPTAQAQTELNHWQAQQSDVSPPPAYQTLQVLQIQADLAQMGYLPVGWNGQAFTFPLPSMPQPLRSLIRPGIPTVLLQGAEWSYESDRKLRPGSLGLSALLDHLAEDARKGWHATHPFTYVYVSEHRPESLLVWSLRGVLREVPANTGVPGAPTALGTHPVFLRLPFQVMRGKNLDSAAYADPVYNISYFFGGEAVHGFWRAGYGYPQSLGCVELPLHDAATIYSEMQIGTLVTVGVGTLTFVATPLLLPPGPTAVP